MYVHGMQTRTDMIYFVSDLRSKQPTEDVGGGASPRGFLYLLHAGYQQFVPAVFPLAYCKQRATKNNCDEKFEKLQRDPGAGAADLAGCSQESILADTAVASYHDAVRLRRPHATKVHPRRQVPKAQVLHSNKSIGPEMRGAEISCRELSENAVLV